MLVVVFAVQMWRSYLIGHHFTILTDHQTLKYFLDQRITTPAQQKWLLKLLWYNYTLAYRPGNFNTTADALSRRQKLLSLIGISQPLFDCVANIQASYAVDQHTIEVIKALPQDSNSRTSFKMQGDLFYYKSSLFVSVASLWHDLLLKEFHASSFAGHSEFLRTYKRLTHNFNWPGLKKNVKSFMATCDVCQRTHYETIKPPGFTAISYSAPSLDYRHGLRRRHSFGTWLECYLGGRRSSFQIRLFHSY